ncbi:MAG: BlaI/MecI/CopY family transcriptional regulator [Candidatus Hydrogenedentes bacterium]|nr:BlaI/MecI/CopY family transcriptional regulator [Candidatus Hydrogenedentota bacterium]
MTRPASRFPTELELEILKILWTDGPSTVRHVRDTLSETRELAYTSVMTMMGIMTEKGYLRRTKKGGGYVYRPKVDRERTMADMLGDTVNRVFNGSAKAAVLHLIESGEIDEDELKELHRLIEKRVEDRR